MPCEGNMWKAGLTERSCLHIVQSPKSHLNPPLKLFIDNWRWADVPFYLRSGKRLPKRISEITIKFRRAPHLLFKGTGTTSIEPNHLSIHIQPDEGMSLMFNAKIPGTTMQIRPVTMEFRYEDAF